MSFGLVLTPGSQAQQSGLPAPVVVPVPKPVNSPAPPPTTEEQQAVELGAAKAAAERIARDPANLEGERVEPQALADTLDINHGAAALQQLLHKLRTRASMMMIVAHPDDEDGGLLAYESRGAGARVAMLTLTRGEGGQNLMSADFNEALGLIRTQELLAEDRYTGVDQFFGTEVDFGFSKTKEETLEKWTHERVLYDAVRAVRLYRPMVLASVFLGGPTDGHGHHQVAGEIAQEVFLAAADPKVFPEMGLPVWAPRKVYARVPFSRVSDAGMYDYATGRTVPTVFHNYVTGGDSHTEPMATVLIHEGDPATIDGKPALGMDGLSYVQFARKGLALQKTQIGANVRLAPSGKSDVGYTLMASRVAPAPEHEESLFTGIDTSLAGLGVDGLGEVDQLLAQAQELFTPANVELCAPPLRDALRKLDAILGDLVEDAPENYDALHELREKRVQLNDALVLAHRLSLKAELTEPKLPGADLPTTVSSLAAKLTVVSASANSYRIVLSRLTVNTAEEGIGVGPEKDPLEPRTEREIAVRLPYLGGLSATRPYFSHKSLEQPYYDVNVLALRNAPATPDPIVGRVTLDDEGVRMELAVVVPSPKVTEPQQALVVVPPVSVDLMPSRVMVSPGQKSLPVSVTVTGEHYGTAECAPKGAPLGGEVGFVLPEDWRLEPQMVPYDPVCPKLAAQFVLTPAKEFGAGSQLQSQVLARANNRNYGEAVRAVGYLGLTYSELYTPAVFRATSLDAAVAPGLKVAYVAGTGDMVPAYLPSLGVTAVVLAPADLTAEKLKAFDAVLLGVRAYSAHPDMNSAALKEYAAAGGVVVLQYLSGGQPADATPYQLEIPGDPAHNVVEEAQPVRLLVPDSPLLNWPNKITAADFDGWVEERGHGFAASWDARFQPLLETRDEGQDLQQGGLLLAPVGKGAYVYLAYAVYRQLPEGVPGAYRLLANLLSYGKNPLKEKQ